MQVPINFKELVSLPFGIFGSTGWGKSVLTKILATWIIQKQLAALVIFDVQGEYTWWSQEGDTPGFATLFGDEVINTLALDKDLAPQGADEFFLYKENVTAGDLQTALSDQGLSVPQVNAIDIIYDEVRRKQRAREWVNLIDFIMEMKEENRPEEVNAKTLPALKNRIKRFAKLKFLRTRDPSQPRGNPIRLPTLCNYSNKEKLSCYILESGAMIKQFTCSLRIL